MTGSIQAGDASADVDPQLWNDILKNLKGALMGGGEAVYRGRWLVNLDLVGARLEAGGERGPFEVGFGPRTFTRDLRSGSGVLPVETRIGTLEVPIRIDPGTLRVDVPRVQTAIGPFEVNVKSLLIETRAQLGYRVADLPALELLGQPAERRPAAAPRRSLRRDPVLVPEGGHRRREPAHPRAGVQGDLVDLRGQGARRRATHSSRRPSRSRRCACPASSSAAPRFGGTDVHESASSWWIDPLVGIRVSADLTERVGIVVAGNVGGFDIGSASKLSWEGLAFLDWRFGESTSFLLGYRGLGLDRQKGKAQADIILHGPLLGLLFRF